MSCIKCICYLAIIGIAAFLLGRILPQKWLRYDRFPWRMWKLERGGAIYRKTRIHNWREDTGMRIRSRFVNTSSFRIFCGLFS